MKIGLRRSGALGDVVLTTPVLQALRARYPGAAIEVTTSYPGVFEHDKRISALRPACNPLDYDLFVELDGAYEVRPRQHIVRAYLEQAFSGGVYPPGTTLQQTLFPDRPDAVTVTPPRMNIVVVHGTGASWRNSLRPVSWWLELHAELRKHNYTTISVGTAADRKGGDVDLRGSLSVYGLWTLLHSAVCFVGSDSGPLHVAGATAVPIVGLFTCCRPELRLPIRGGVVGGDCIGLTPALDCVGCQQDLPPPVTTVGCRRGDFACAESGAAVSVAQVVDAVCNLTRHRR